jgi:tetratricopeptide (TPR) repeat protein
MRPSCTRTWPNYSCAWAGTRTRLPKCASLKLGPSASGLLADAHVRRAQGDAAGQVAALRQAKGEVEFEAGDDNAESVYLELAEAELHTLDLPGAQAHARSADPGRARFRQRAHAPDRGLLGAGRHGKAVAALRAALAEEPNQIEALAALAWIHAATGKNDEARAVFREAIDRSEGALEIAAAYARFLVGIGSAKEAEQVADDLAVPDSSLDAETDAQTITGRVELERSARRLDRALALLSRTRDLGIAENQKTRISLTQAALLKEQGKSDEALAVLMKVGKDSPLYFEARLRAGELLRDAGKAAEATRVIEDAAAAAKGERDAIDAEAAVSLALIDEKRGDAKSGVARLEKILARDPDESRAIMILAAIEERRGNWQRALAIVERHLAKNPGSVEALNFWGFVAADHDHALDLAKKRLQAACALDPGSGGLIDSLGWVHFRGKDMAKASLFLEQAARLEPADAEIQWHLGESYAERKDGERAAAAYRRGLGFNPDERVRRKLEDSLAKLAGRKVSGK